MIDSGKHESYGVVRVSRVTGGDRRLFGSPLKRHGTTITLSIHRASCENSMGEEHIFGSLAELIEVEMSVHQWATLLTSLNMGDGVPCTLRRLSGRSIEPVPKDYVHEIDHAYEDVRTDFERARNALKDIVDDALSLLTEKKTISKRDREVIRRALIESQRFFWDQGPFVLEQFGRAVQRVTTAAKQEVDSFITSSLQSIGLNEAKRRQLAGLLPGLPEEGESR